MRRALAALRRFLVSGEPPEPASETEALALVSAADDQGLAGLLAEALTARRRVWPAAAAASLRDRHRAVLHRSLRLLDALRRARERLRAAGLRSLPMKGAALQDFYASPGDRPMADADLLVLDGWDRALQVLAAAGYATVERADHAWALADPESGLVLELHRGLCTAPGLFPIDQRALWDRRTGVPGEERPASDDLLVQLAVHAAFQHGLALKLVHYLDFRLVLEKGGVDPERVLERARAARAEACLLAALEASEGLVAAAAPPGLVAELRRTAPRRLSSRLAALRKDPLALVERAAAPRDVAAWRMALVGRRRLELLARTLLPAHGPRGGRLAGAARRGIRLARSLGRGR